MRRFVTFFLPNGATITIQATSDSGLPVIVQLSRSRFPLLPPLVEIPYIGTVAGIPIPGAKEYHTGTAVLSAMVVPTAADIAYGIRFLHDRVVDGVPGQCSFLAGSARRDQTLPIQEGGFDPRFEPQARPQLPQVHDRLPGN